MRLVGLLAKSRFQVTSAHRLTHLTNTWTFAYTFTQGLTLTGGYFASSQPNMGRTNYAPSCGGIGEAHTNPTGWGRYSGLFWPRSKKRFSDCVDGTSNTMAFGESFG